MFSKLPSKSDMWMRRYVTFGLKKMRIMKKQNGEWNTILINLAKIKIKNGEQNRIQCEMIHFIPERNELFYFPLKNKIHKFNKNKNSSLDYIRTTKHAFFFLFSSFFYF